MGRLHPRRRTAAAGSPPHPLSRAHILLAALGRTAPVLSLSQTECAALAPLVTEWFERGASEEYYGHSQPACRRPSTTPPPWSGTA
ncbi:hypothetical protein ACFZCT_21095 [Streptomyces qaidamensis]|uniref:hypothetical protein n=1 Tax=Streptomyces qaidamensis TaxID=1783515 RepID=UPI0036EB0052